MRRCLAVLGALATLVASIGGVRSAVAVDLHSFWDQRCAECHGHSADFARKSLRVENGRLVGFHHRDNLRAFMAQHQTTSPTSDRLHDMLLAQAQTPPLFRERCGECHGTASDFARASLIRKQDVLTGRKTGRPVAIYLRRHAKLTEQEVPFFVDLLERVDREVRSP